MDTMTGMTISIISFLLFSLSAHAEVTCRSLFSGSPDTKVEVNVKWNVDEAQVFETVQDVRAAIAFAKDHFQLPPLIRLIVVDKGTMDNHFPSYDGSSKILTYPYLFGTIRDGRFISKSRLHSRDIFFHEFGHALWESHNGSPRDWLERYEKSYYKALSGGGYFTRVPNEYVKAYIASYEELFADIFAVAITQNPRSMYSSGRFTLEHLPLANFQAARQDLLHARNFLWDIDVTTWQETEVHIRLAPTRTALLQHPHAAFLLRKNPQKLARLALDAIEKELNLLFGEDVRVLSNTTVPELNARMIKVLHGALSADQGRKDEVP
jgi:hypothetical protein